MAKYYVITAGEYSDYGIVNITTNRKLAEAYLKVHNSELDYMNIEEYDDLMDQCDIQDTIDEASIRHPYMKVIVTQNGNIDSPDWLKEKLMNKNNACEFCWGEKPPEEPAFNDHRYSIYMTFEMWVQVDKYNYDFDKIVKVVMDTRAKMMAEREGL